MVHYHGNKRITARHGAHRRGRGWFSDAFDQVPLVGGLIHRGLDKVYNHVNPGGGIIEDYLGDNSMVGKMGKPLMEAAVQAGLQSVGGPALGALGQLDKYVSQGRKHLGQLEGVIGKDNMISRAVHPGLNAYQEHSGEARRALRGIQKRRGRGFDLGDWARSVGRTAGISNSNQDTIGRTLAGAYNGAKGGSSRRGGWDLGGWAQDLAGSAGINRRDQDTIGRTFAGAYNGAKGGSSRHGGWDLGGWAQDLAGSVGVNRSDQDTIGRTFSGAYNGAKGGGWDLGEWSRDLGSRAGIGRDAQDAIGRAAVGAYHGAKGSGFKHGSGFDLGDWARSVGRTAGISNSNQDTIGNTIAGAYRGLGGGRSRWQHHVKQFHGAHPHLTFKQALQAARHSYS